MNTIKERIIGAVTIMTEDDANFVWNVIQSQIAPKTWEDIEEITPDEIDIKMLDEIANDPLCNEFISGNDLLKEFKEL